jgi:ADP-ribosylglycohydrolase
MVQKNFLDEPPEGYHKVKASPDIDKYLGAIVFSAVGDALGWPTEFLDPNRSYTPPFRLPIRSFVEWTKLVGGKWWGYEDVLSPGSYSDDTQLSLAVARCINELGSFEPERFAYEELPLWLQYERGGGRSVKAAARKLISKRAHWLRNYYKVGDLEYRSAGANGAAMRSLPIALANAGQAERIIIETFLSSIITHGHPRAILGAILYALAVNYALTMSTGSDFALALLDYLNDGVAQIGKVVAPEPRIQEWLHEWERNNPKGNRTFRQIFNEAREETCVYLNGAFNDASARDYYLRVGAFDPATKGSGVGTVCAAVYLFIRYLNSPDEALLTAVNMLGSDSDTIASFVGALHGSYHGLSSVPTHLGEQIQDRDYLLRTAMRLRAIATGEQSEHVATSKTLERKDAYLRILAWEIGLHEMFWDALDNGDTVVHPTLGRGTIVHKVVKPIRRDDYVAKLISIIFDSGQSCTFHSLVQDNTRVSESLSEEVERALGL